MKTAARRERLLHLLHRGTTTVPAIASALGVSARTVHRDIAALREGGHSIRATPGPGGGVRIAPDSRPRPVHFEVAEIVGLALSVAVLKATPHMPFAGPAAAGLDRACRALSPERRRALRRLERRIFIGAPASARVARSLGAVDHTVLPAFEQCFTGGRALAFAYVDAAGAASSRRIECMALVLHRPVWYVLAWDLDKDAARLFRMDRIARARAGAALDQPHPLALVMPRLSPADDQWHRAPLA